MKGPGERNLRLWISLCGDVWLTRQTSSLGVVNVLPSGGDLLNQSVFESCASVSQVLCVTTGANEIPKRIRGLSIGRESVCLICDNDTHVLHQVIRLVQEFPGGLRFGMLPVNGICHIWLGVRVEVARSSWSRWLRLPGGVGRLPGGVGRSTRELSQEVSRIE